jgi:DnaJ-class molecular chaperone
MSQHIEDGDETYMLCPECRGSGHFGTRNCPYCDGSGEVVIKPANDDEKIG